MAFGCAPLPPATFDVACFSSQLMLSSNRRIGAWCVLQVIAGHKTGDLCQGIFALRSADLYKRDIEQPRQLVKLGGNVTDADCAVMCGALLIPSFNEGSGAD